MITLGNLEHHQREQHITYVVKEPKNCRSAVTFYPALTYPQMPG